MSNRSVTTTTTSNTSTNKVNYTIIPPLNFSYIEEKLSRCHLPLNKSNISFLQSISTECIINLSGKKLDSSFTTYCDEVGIILINMLQDTDIPMMTNISKFQEWIVLCIDMILKQSAKFITMIVGSVDNYYDCIILACLRRFQKWSFVSIIGELRHNVWPYKLLDYEQFIEQFNTDLINKDIIMPEYISKHEKFKLEEIKLLKRCAKHNEMNVNISNHLAVNNALIEIDDEEKHNHNVLEDNLLIVNTNQTLHYLHKDNNYDYKINHNNSSNSDNNHSIITESVSSDNIKDTIDYNKVYHENNVNNTFTNKNINTDDGYIQASDNISKNNNSNNQPLQLLNDQIRVDNMLNNLFFSPQNEILSDGITFDIILSLINEKDEED